MDGGWTEWSEWSCPPECGSSKVLTRSRRCNNPTPLDGGADCVGDQIEGREEVCTTGVQCVCRDYDLEEYCEYYRDNGYCSYSSGGVPITDLCMVTCGVCSEGEIIQDPGEFLIHELTENPP